MPRRVLLVSYRVSGTLWISIGWQDDTSSVWKAIRYDLTREDVAAWDCPSTDTLSAFVQQ